MSWWLSPHLAHPLAWLCFCPSLLLCPAVLPTRLSHMDTMLACFCTGCIYFPCTECSASVHPKVPRTELCLFLCSFTITLREGLPRFQNTRAPFVSALGCGLTGFQFHCSLLQLFPFTSRFNNLGLLFLLTDLAKNFQSYLFFSKNQTFHQFFVVLFCVGFC